MDLVDGGERRAGEDGVGGAAAIGGGEGGVLPAAEPAIACNAAEEAVRDGGQRAARTMDHKASRMTMSSSAWVPTMKA